MTLEQQTKKILSINKRLRKICYNDNNIDQFWANIFRLAPKIEEIGLENIKICTGCGHLDIEPINPPHLACCPDSNYIPVDPVATIEVEADIICTECKEEVLENMQTAELYCVNCDTAK